jgi:formylglycine-generating enzyme
MDIDKYTTIISYGRSGRPGNFLEKGRELEARGNSRLAASFYDRAFSLDPSDEEIVDARRSLLDRLAVVEHGIVFRYIPAGIFHMGSTAGDPDEAPVHFVFLNDYWLSETPVSWAAYCDVMGWAPPPVGIPRKPAEANREEFHSGLFLLFESNKIRLRYCTDPETRKLPPNFHLMVREALDGKESDPTSDLSGTSAGHDPNQPSAYDQRPMVCASWQDAEELCARITTEAVVYRLPTEAEWERAARGGLINARYPWGDQPPDETRCDFNRFAAFSILPMRQFPPNDYGLYAMSGGVWEWTSDWYDSAYYHESDVENPQGPAKGDARVLRGGSWADCAEAVTVSFRMAREAVSWRKRKWGPHLAPNIGFRLCRFETTGRVTEFLR